MQDNIVDDGFVVDKLREAGRSDLAEKFVENGKRVELALDVIATKTESACDTVETMLKNRDVKLSL